MTVGIPVGAEKRFREQIVAFQWSSQHDLLALATDQSQVLLHRYERLERVWIFEKLESIPNARISGLCWRHDGCVLAVSYYIDGSDCFFKLLEVESGQGKPVDLFGDFDLTLPSKAISMSWTKSHYRHKLDENITFFKAPPPVSKNETTPEISKIVTKELTILTVVLESGEIMGFGFGVVPLFFLNVEGSPAEAILSTSFDILDIVTAPTEDDFTHYYVDTQSLMQNHHQVHRYCSYVIAAQLTIIYLQSCIREMKQTWQDRSGPLFDIIPAELSDHLLSMFLWGVQSPEIIRFLSRNMPQDSFYKVGQEMTAKFQALQKLSLINVMQACDKLSALINHLSSFTKLPKLFELFAPEHSLINFEYIESRACELAMKNTLFLRELDDVMTCAPAFGTWLAGHYAKMASPDAQDGVSANSELTDTEEELVIRFIRTHLTDKDKIGDFFESSKLEESDFKKTPWQNLLDDHDVSNPLLLRVDPHISLKTALDYVRRLFTKYCFRQENDRFGCPKSKFCSLIKVVSTTKVSAGDGETLRNRFSTICSNIHKESFAVAAFSESFLYVLLSEPVGTTLNGLKKLKFKLPSSSSVEDMMLYRVRDTSVEVIFLETSEDLDCQTLSLVEFIGDHRKVIASTNLSIHNHKYSRLTCTAARELIATYSSDGNVIQAFTIPRDA